MAYAKGPVLSLPMTCQFGVVPFAQSWVLFPAATACSWGWREVDWFLTVFSNELWLQLQRANFVTPSSYSLKLQSSSRLPSQYWFADFSARTHLLPRISWQSSGFCALTAQCSQWKGNTKREERKGLGFLDFFKFKTLVLDGRHEYKALNNLGFQIVFIGSWTR